MTRYITVYTVLASGNNSQYMDVRCPECGRFCGTRTAHEMLAGLIAICGWCECRFTARAQEKEEKKEAGQ